MFDNSKALSSIGIASALASSECLSFGGAKSTKSRRGIPAVLTHAYIKKKKKQKAAKLARRKNRPT